MRQEKSSSRANQAERVLIIRLNNVAQPASVRPLALTRLFPRICYTYYALQPPTSVFQHLQYRSPNAAARIGIHIRQRARAYSTPVFKFLANCGYLCRIGRAKKPG